MSDVMPQYPEMRLIELEQKVRALEEAFATFQELVSPEDVEAAKALKQLTPPNARLLELADKNPPPAEWFEGDVERPW